MADDVQLTDLLVIQRYSLAVRSTTVPREELLAALQADVDWLCEGLQVTAAVQVPANTAREKSAADAGPSVGRATPTGRPTAAKAQAARLTAAKVPSARLTAAKAPSARPTAANAPAARTAVRASGVRSPRA